MSEVREQTDKCKYDSTALFSGFQILKRVYYVIELMYRKYLSQCLTHSKKPIFNIFLVAYIVYH